MTHAETYRIIYFYLDSRTIVNEYKCNDYRYSIQENKLILKLQGNRYSQKSMAIKTIATVFIAKKSLKDQTSRIVKVPRYSEEMQMPIPFIV